MPADFVTLVRRDHLDLSRELTRLLDPGASVGELRTALDGVRLGLTAHAEAEDIVLTQMASCPALAVLIAQAREAHHTQETALGALVLSIPHTNTWRERAQYLRDLVETHARVEEDGLFVALREHTERDCYLRLAGAFATERMRQLSMLQPSAPLFVPELASL